MAGKQKLNNVIVCMRCGTALRITGEVEETKPTNIDVDDILHLFSSRVRKSLKVVIEGNHAIIELTGKYDSKKWKEVNEEVRGYAGRWVKGHFVLPTVGLGEKP